LKINYSECAVCNICLEACPNNAIKKQGYKIIITEKCINCKNCLDVCPLGAIYNEKE